LPSPYPYQREGITFLRNARRAILADEQGLGKTPQALLAAAEADAFPILIAAPRSAQGVWEDETAKWLDMKAALYSGQRRSLGKDDPVVVTTYGVFGEILRKRAWRTVIYDEAHKLRNRKATTLYGIAKNAPSPFLFSLTGTPIVNRIDDMWTLLNMADPVKWKSYWNFAKRYMIMEKNDFGYGWDYFGEQNVAELRRRTQSVFLRRLERDVAPERPERTRQPVPLELDGLQKRVYDQMANDMLIRYGDNWLAAPTEVAKITRLRQLLCTPLILCYPDEGAIFRALREVFDDTPHPAVIFVPFQEAIPHLRQYLKGVMHTREISSKHSRHLKEDVEWFQTSTDRNRALIVTVGMGTSWSATASSQAYFAGFGWGPTDHEQAERRLARHGQLFPVTAHYFVHRGAVDETALLPIVDRKMTTRMMALDPHLMLRRRR
jgi:SWI/SNF-related matrix-associated actin-dependent regulator of chromatin subfamily A-like protein 1